MGSAPLTTVDGVDIVPGTEIMREDEKMQMVLVPKPSQDPADPLNWSFRWKCKLPLSSPSLKAFSFPNG